MDVPRDDGSKQRIYRCPTCQVAVYSDYGRPEVLFVRAGTLDQPWTVSPDVHIFTKSKLSGDASGVGAGLRGLLRQEGLVAGRQPRAVRRDPGAGGLLADHRHAAWEAVCP